MKRLLIILATVTLSGCIEDQKRQVAKCELELLKTNKPDQLGFVRTCMQAAGYKFHLANTKCHVPQPLAQIERDPYCYWPDNQLGQWLYENIEEKFSN